MVVIRWTRRAWRIVGAVGWLSIAISRLINPIGTVCRYQRILRRDQNSRDFRIHKEDALPEQRRHSG